jgi:hypothetical protein
MAYRSFEDQDLPIQRPKSEGGWHQGVYKVVNYKKYMSNKPPIFRSSWEANMMYLFDMNSFVTRWGSEILEIPYMNPIDSKVHRYFADFYVEFKDKNGKYIKWVIEVKPADKLHPPKQKKRTKTWAYQMNEYVINVAKWTAARAYCQHRGYEFKIFTDDEIKSLCRSFSSDGH